MKKLRVGIAGLGRVASKTHIPVLTSIGNVAIVAGAEQNLQRAERVRQMFGLESVYSSFEEMYASAGLDAVYVCLPNFLHKDACMAAIARDIHVLCEKPMGMSVEEAEQMTVAAESRGLVLMPGYKKRYAPNFARAKTMIEEGILGRILHVQGIFLNPGPYISWDPKSDWYLDEKLHGVIYDSACHLIDLLLYILPLDIGSVRSVGHKGFNGYNTPTNVTCCFEMAGGVLGDLTVGWRSATDALSLSFHGTSGSISVSRDAFSYFHPGSDPIDKIAIDARNACTGVRGLLTKVTRKIKGKGFYPEDVVQAQLFFDAIMKKDIPLIKGGDAVRVHRFLQLAMENIVYI